MSRLVGKIALITGGSRGIGAAVARKLATLGATLAITFKDNREAALQVAKDVQAAGAKAEVFQVDVADAASVKAMIGAVVAKFGKIDIVVNSAGIYEGRPFGKNDAAFFKDQFGTNTFGTLAVMEEAVPHFPKSGGRIVNMASQLAQDPRDGSGVYAASKAAVSVLTHAFARELGSRGITVNAVAPATTRTDMAKGISEESCRALAAKTPLGRIGEPEDIADVTAFLVSDEARWITGRTLLADGGLT